MNQKRILNALILLTLIASSANAADAPAPLAAPPDVFALNARLGRGVNVLGYDPIWKDPDRARFRADHFRLLREAGFNHVRINLHPFRDVKGSANPPMTEAYLQTLDWAVDQALANHLLVVLDLHEFQFMAKDPQSKKERFIAAWTQLAEHCKARPADVLFELLNEPHGELTPELWNDFLRDALAVVRPSNPSRAVIIGPGFWNGIKHLDSLRLPAEDRNIIATVHYYDPMSFTHQGATWAKQSAKTGIPWGSPQEKQAVVTTFDRVSEWSARERRPIYLGEFGAYDKADMPFRVTYAAFVAREAEKHQFSWAWWQFDSDFVLYDIPNKHWIEPLRDALIPPAR
jgi:endoglucanase